MKKETYISTNIMKAVAILFVIVMHSLQYNKALDYSLIYRTLGFDFWVAQAVSIFVVITGFHYAMSIEKLEKEIVWYRKDIFLKKLLRILPVYSVAFLFWIIYILVTGSGNVGLQCLFIYLKGGLDQVDIIHQ